MNRKQAIWALIVVVLSACEGQTAIDSGEVVTMEATAADSQESDRGEMMEPETLIGLEYRPEAFFENQLDLYLPAAGVQELHPAVLLFHGGGQDKHHMQDLAVQLVEAGYAVAAANFRSIGGGEYPGSVEDAFCALAWMVDSADSYEMDIDQIYAVGFSMGGTLASMLAVVEEPELYLGDCLYSIPTDFQLAGVVVYTGIFDYAAAAEVNQAMRDYVEGYLGGTIEERPQVWDQASVINWVDGSEPPFLLLHGETDENIPPQQTNDFETRLIEAGVPVDKFIVPGVDHIGLIADPTALDAMFSFLSN